MKVLAAFGAAVLVIAGFASPAASADLGATTYKDEGVPYAGGKSWSGIYVDGFIGGELTALTFENVDAGLVQRGVYGGLRLGAAQQINTLVLEAFLEGSLSSASTDVGNATITKDLTWAFGVAPGVTFGDTLVYMPISYVTTYESVDGGPYSLDDNVHGWRFGAGVKRRLTESGWGIGAEGGWTTYDTSHSNMDGVDFRLIGFKRF